ncbi:MAG: 50S ribosome-binding GTPase [Gemmataceae bacterium]|nr:50S ribosome-binding GTPase [Gemmataceae bacterium]
MSQATTQTGQPAAQAAAGAMRVVLFGMPDAGKSSLLGALAQAAQIQEHLLNGKLIDKSQGLLELQRRLYEERPRETLEEVAPFPVRFEPFPPRSGASAPSPFEVVLVDCDGRVANELLTQKQALQAGKRNGALARAVLDADALVLVVDSASDPATLQRDFTQFALFLRLLEEGRGRRSEVGGLPVYLVLTKCDLLAQKGDTAAGWMDRIEERKRQVDRKFREFLAQHAGRENMPFGKVDLHLWATAVKRPVLADAPAKPREPYGVAELFRQALDSAGTFREHRQRAERRLRTVVGLVAGLFGMLVLLTLLLVLSQPSEELETLTQEVRTLRLRMGTQPQKRLSGDIDKRLQDLNKIRESKYFGKLPEEEREFVGHSIEELTEYRDFTDRLQKAAKTFDGKLTTIFDEDALKEVEEKLKAAAPSVRYAPEWAKTEAVRDRQRWTQEAAALRKAVQEIRDEYKALNKDAEQIQKLADEKNYNKAIPLAKEAQQRAEALQKKKEDAQRIEGEITYAQVFQFDSVVQAQRRWEQLRKAFRAKLGI